MAQKIYGVGEVVLDVIFKNDRPIAANPGGSVLNSLVSLGRASVLSSFISELGNDHVGNLIMRFLEDNNIDTSYIRQFEDGKSALAMAFLDDDNNAKYDFYKFYPCQRLEEKMPSFEKNDIFLFGSFYGLDKEVRNKVKWLLERANEKDAIIYYDPNFRSSHLDELPDLLPVINENFGYADIIRASDEDCFNILKVDNATDAYEVIKQYCPVFIYTASNKGVDLFAYSFNKHYNVKNIQPVSTIGAGDNFNAGIIYTLKKNNIIKEDIRLLSEEMWDQIINNAIDFSANACMTLDNYISEDFADEVKQINGNS